VLRNLWQTWFDRWGLKCEQFDLNLRLTALLQHHYLDPIELYTDLSTLLASHISHFRLFSNGNFNECVFISQNKSVSILLKIKFKLYILDQSDRLSFYFLVKTVIVFRSLLVYR